MSDLREQILTATTVREELVEIPEWPDSDGNPAPILVRGLGGTARGKVMRASRGPGGDIDTTLMSTPLLIACMLNPNTRQPIFTDADREALGEQSSVVLDRLANKAAELSGMDEATEDEAKKD